MATSVTLPALGESVTEGTVTRWLKQEGDTVEADEPLLEVSTDKVDTEIPSPAAGTLLSIKVQEDETVVVGAELAVIGDAADQGSEGSDSGAPAGDGADESEASAVDVTSDEGSAGDQADGGSAGQTAQETSEPVGVSTGSVDSGSQSTSGGSTGGSSTDGSSTDGSSTDGSSTDGSSTDGSSSGGSSSGGSEAGVSVTLPALGESVTEGTVTRWLKQEGDTVEADEPLLEVSTDKVDTEIPSPAAGTLLSIKVQEDETVEVGAELAVIGSPSQGGATGDDGQASQSGDESGVPTDEQPAAVEEKALAEQQESRIEAESSGTPPAEVSGTSSTDGAATSPSRADGPAGETSTSTASSATPEPSKAPAQTAATPSAQSTSGGGSGDSASSDGAYVTPLVRKLATDAGIALNEVSGSGVGGRIRKQDVLEAAAARESAAAKEAADAEAKASADKASQAVAAPAADATQPASSAGSGAAPSGASASLRGQTVKMTRMRAFIAKRMVESLQISAQLTTVVEVDVTQIARLRNQAKSSFQAREGVKLSFLPFFAKAAIEALREYPSVNSSINAETNEVTYHGAEHLGIAVDTERGLIVPVIHDAGDLNIGGLARKIADLAERTRTNKISPDELSGGTFTLTNTGSRGALFDTPILNQPQVGILGTGAVVKRPVVIDDPRLGETIVVRSMVYLALTYDHRIVDGADAARFLMYMKHRLEEGQFESDLGL